MCIIYEDNHLLIISKSVGEIVQGDKTGDRPLSDLLKDFIKEREHKPGNVFLHPVHRLDRPVAGLVIFAKTSKALSRMNALIRNGKISKTYRLLSAGLPPSAEGNLSDYLAKNESQNKSYVVSADHPGAKEARLGYRLLTRGERYNLIEVELYTGRHHQIRCQMAACGCIIKGDLKYGAPRSNPGGGISLIAYRLSFEHPVSGQSITVTDPMDEAESLFSVLSPRP